MRQDVVERNDTNKLDAESSHASLPLKSSARWMTLDKYQLERDTRSQLQDDSRKPSLNTSSVTDITEANDLRNHHKRIQHLFLTANKYLQQKNHESCLEKYNELLFLVESLGKHNTSQRHIVNEDEGNTLHYQHLTAEVFYRVGMVHESIYDWDAALIKYRNALNLFQCCKTKGEGEPNCENKPMRHSVEQVNERIMKITSSIDLMQALCDKETDSVLKPLRPNTKANQMFKKTMGDSLSREFSDNSGLLGLESIGTGDSDLPSLKASLESSNLNKESQFSIQSGCKICMNIYSDTLVYIFNACRNIAEHSSSSPIPEDIVVNDNQTATSSITGCQYTTDRHRVKISSELHTVESSVEFLHEMPPTLVRGRRLLR